MTHKDKLIEIILKRTDRFAFEKLEQMSVSTLENVAIKLIMQNPERKEVN